MQSLRFLFVSARQPCQPPFCLPAACFCMAAYCGWPLLPAHRSTLSTLCHVRFCRRPPHRPPHNFYKTEHWSRPLLVFFFFLSSLALFAYWLRSSVVSVLFSLISERCLLASSLIIPIFGFRMVSSVLAHDSNHSVPGITLPPGDANQAQILSPFSFHCLRLVYPMR